MISEIIGNTIDGENIVAYHNGNMATKKFLIIGGVHGDETEGIVAANFILELARSSDIFTGLAVIPTLNIDGYKKGVRKNANGVDLNRNLPTKDWTPVETEEKYYPGIKPNSEPENQALLRFVNSYSPSLIISLHSYKKPMLNVNGDCVNTAREISHAVKYPVETTIGYPTPGCLGTYYGLERDIPVITYEFLRGIKQSEITQIHAPAIFSVIKSDA